MALLLGSRSVRLSDCPKGKSFELVRVLDQSPEFLRYLSEVGLSIGAMGVIVSQRPEAGIIKLRVGGCEASIGQEAAQKLKVSVQDSR